jgi:putative membrane protein insertion efficiency factor
MKTAPRPWQTDTLRDVHRGGVGHDERRRRLTVPLVWLIRIYQRTISPIFGQVCGYYPSCSAYGVTALERHGLVRGVALTAWRVLRCNPWSAGGVDHVPPPHTHNTQVSTAHHKH